MYTVLDEGNITNIAVEKSYRRKNGGRMLVQAIVNEANARKLSFLTLEVRLSNLPAIKLYESCGFARVGLRKNYYEHPREDALLMTKRLAPEKAENP
jgi:ribosomal-protein-alanine N-acetyltransferase